MNDKDSRYKESKATQGPPDGQRWSAYLEATGDHTKASETANDHHHPEDEADREARAIAEWVSRKFRGAKFIDLANVVLALILIVVGICAAFIYDGQLAQMRHTNELTKKALDGSDRALEQTKIKMQGQIDAVNDGNTLAKNALLSTQRAFLYVGKFNISRVGNLYKVNFVWSNGGTTPTRLMREAVHVRLFKDDMPDNFILYDPAEKGTELVVGPKADSNGRAEVLSAADLESAAAYQGHLYIWGWARYYDVFDRTPQHLTEFCTEVTDVVYSPGNINFVTSSCERGNCTDDECKNQ